METEAKRYTIWEKKKKKNNSSNNDKILIRTSSYDDSWEEQAFAEDAAGNLGGCVWPPRSYSCSFCKREFRSAQALGGHMNVHRRDRARLKHESLQSHIEHPEKNNPFKPLADVHHPSDQICDLVFNPNPNPKSSSSWFSQNFEESDYRAKRNHDSIEVTRTHTHHPIIFHKWYQNTDLSSQKHQTSNSIDDSDNGNGDDDLVCRKRKRTDASSIAFFLRSSTVSDHYVKPEVIGLSPSSIDELDLELRLGDGRPKQKPKLK